ncbi:MAG: DUF6465 family protein [Lachnospiraceae bacterium]|nr:DUF6465 family protein [Lachnospiraceae bacterium]MDD7378125.1 DUF6465 family protein [Lachnospiraceae bacterium]MDY4617369.1 DUF6465 family protein [Lachnospiraceae bacterium]MDY5774704.1 DUF6465 family protein [Lachnospiraceae bacterium]
MAEKKVAEVKEVKPAEVKAAVKAEEEKVVEKAAEVKETVKATVKTAAKKTAQKKTTRKTTTKKEASSTEVFVEFYGQQSSVESVEERVKAAFVAEGHKAGTIKSLKIYLKPEEQAAYYVINDKFAGRVDLF